MKVISKIPDLKKQIGDWKKEGFSIGFCPTMGSLHSGHMDLVETSKKHTDKTIVSIFVNPTQFNDPKDFEQYPVKTDSDLLLCETNGVDMVFLPEVKTMYPETKTPIYLSIPELQKHLCGRTRPGHFEGVLLIVTKLFHLIEPNKTFFGLKDYQQFRVISTMVENLNFPLEVIGVPTRRDSDGLALSSRNVRLSEKERETASLIPRMFALAKKTILSGERDLNLWKEILRDFLLTGTSLRIDYLEVVDPIFLQPKDKLEGEVLLAIAVFVGDVRLIDNQIIQIPN